MCDYSLHNVKSRAARVGDKLTTRNFGTGTRGFAAQEDASMAVCVLPGTELAFSRDVACTASGFLGCIQMTIGAAFVQLGGGVLVDATTVLPMALLLGAVVVAFALSLFGLVRPRLSAV